MAEDKQSKELKEKKLIKHLEFLYDCYTKGLTLTEKDLKKLEKNGYIKSKKEDLPEKPKERKITPIADGRTDLQEKADNLVDVIDLTNEDYKDAFEDEGSIVYSKILDERFTYRGGKKISRSDWLPKSTVYHTEEFIKWVDSINSGFQKMTQYKPFQMYCQQAAEWMEDKSNIYDYEDEDQRREWAFTEMERMAENSLYFLDRYLLVKEPDFEHGYMDYQSKPVHKVMAFLFDCGYNVEMGKGRQIAATTTICGLSLCRIITKKNYFVKFIAQDDEKVQEIFEDKVKWAHSELPGWLFQKPRYDRDNLLHLGKKKEKGKPGGSNSRMKVVPPSVAAINGGAPPLVLVDEAGYIGILGKMIKEARPTMFMQDPQTGKIAMRRQIWIWGTGGEMDKKGKAYEEEYRMTFKKWQDRDFTYGIIPIFFDWTTRPGVTKEHYDNEKRAYTVQGPEAEEKEVQFRQTYPSIIEDMFLTSSKTLVPITYINKRIEDIRSEPVKQSEYGYFEPVYDTTKPSAEHDDLPFKLIGAEFVRTEKSDPRASVRIFQRPKTNWVDRYYQGTDPIGVDNGLSNMASAIWDAYYNTVSAVVNYRESDHKGTFLQVLCLGLYYDAQRSKGEKQRVPELLEGNIGTTYSDYVEYKGYERSLVLNSELQSAFVGGKNGIGIDNRGQRTRFIIAKMAEVIALYGDRIYIEDFWVQLTTFHCTFTDAGNETWGTQNARKYHDDVLFAIVFSYICSISFSYRQPRNIERKEDNHFVRHELQRDVNGNLRRVPVKKAIA